jgi:hypothetical protein
LCECSCEVQNILWFAKTGSGQTCDKLAGGGGGVAGVAISVSPHPSRRLNCVPRNLPRCYPPLATVVHNEGSSRATTEEETSSQQSSEPECVQTCKQHPGQCERPPHHTARACGSKTVAAREGHLKQSQRGRQGRETRTRSISIFADCPSLEPPEGPKLSLLFFGLPAVDAIFSAHS